MKQNKNGFTLMEMLIVIAIIAVLIAVAIPVFASQLEKTREATDLANVRSAYAQVSTEALLGDSEATVTVDLKQKQADLAIRRSCEYRRYCSFQKPRRHGELERRCCAKRNLCRIV